MNKAVFLDKDGTISRDLGYLDDPRKLELLPGSSQAIKMLNEAGYKIFIVSNQAGIARGHLNENILQAIDKRLHKLLINEGAVIDEIYYCPHHQEHGSYPYKTKCSCRKPGTGMLEKAIKSYNIDTVSSYLIGDKKTDIEAGQKLGIKTVLVLTGYGQEQQKTFNAGAQKPDHIAPDLLAAAKWILK